MLVTVLLFLAFCLPLWMPLACVPMLRKHNQFSDLAFVWTWGPLLALAALWTIGMTAYALIRSRAKLPEEVR